MATYVILSTMENGNLSSPGDFTNRASEVNNKIKQECPNVTWVDSYCLMGPYDVLDIVESDKPEEVQKAAMIIRVYGHAKTQTFAATKWDDFINALK
jgi:uncharacterized protein with GYD domain